MPPPSMPLLGRLEPPVRRVLAIDAGSRRIKLALVEKALGRLRILRQESVDLHAEGLVSAEELSAHLRTTIEDWGRPPIALTLPQELSTSQLIDLPPVPDAEAGNLIEEEAKKLSGVSDSAIIYDFARLRPLAPNRQHFWVTLCQEGKVREQIKRLGLDAEDLCEVTTTANALAAAMQEVAPQPGPAVLLHAGAESTVLVVVLDGQAVFAGSFAVGGDFFTRAIASQLKCAIDAAEDLKQRKDLLSGSGALPELTAAVERWFAELKRQLQDWSQEHRSFAPDLADCEITVSGGVFAQPGLLAYLNQRGGSRFHLWPAAGAGGSLRPADGFEVALGTALHALGRSAQPASLLPADRRAAWRRRLTRQLIDVANGALLALVLLVMTAATWKNASLVRSKEALRDKALAGLEQARTNATFAGKVLADYEQVRSLLSLQRQTTDTLKTVALLQQARSNRSLWFVLLADQQTYFTTPVPVTFTNPPGQTNLIAVIRHLGATLTNLFGPGGAAPTNALLIKPGFIAELCIPEEAEPARRTLSQLVNALKKDPAFAKVDSLSEDLRRGLADPKVLLTDRHFALALELADAEMQRPAAARRRLPGDPTNVPPKAASRPFKPEFEPAETSNPTPNP